MNRIPPNLIPVINGYLRSAPVNVAGMANDFGLSIFESDLANGVSGAIIRDETYKTPSGFVIFVNSKEAYVRQRFTAAHEIGHFVLHKDKIGNGIEDNYLLRSSELSTATEREANKFAADILMPYDLIESYVAQGVSTVPALAKLFEVSEIAMAIRLGHPT